MVDMNWGHGDLQKSCMCQQDNQSARNFVQHNSSQADI